MNDWPVVAVAVFSLESLVQREYLEALFFPFHDLSVALNVPLISSDGDGLVASVVYCDTFSEHHLLFTSQLYTQPYSHSSVVFW